MTFDVAFGDGEDIVEGHFLGDGVRVAEDVGYGVLDLVRGRDLLPGGEEHPLVELPVFGEQDMRWHQAREVKHVHVVFDRNLK